MRCHLAQHSHLLLLMLGVVGVSCTPRENQDNLVLPPSDDGNVFDQAWTQQVLRGIENSKYEIQPAGFGFVGKNTGAGLHIAFMEDEVAVSNTSGDSSIGLTFTGWGRNDEIQPVEPVLPFLGGCLDSGEKDSLGNCLERLEYSRGNAIEWWANRHAGLEQGWELLKRPNGSGKIRIDVQVAGADLDVDEAGERVLMTTENGDIFQYWGPIAWDANGTVLPALLDISDNTIHVIVDDQGATWPITVDPIVDSGTTYSPTAGTGGQFGAAVAMGLINGDDYPDLVVGAPTTALAVGGAATMGKVYVYLSSGNIGTGSLDSVADVVISGVRGDGSMGGKFGTSLAVADVTGDSSADILIGAPTFVSEGYVFIYNGSGITGTLSIDDADISIEGTSNSEFGTSLVVGAGLGAATKTVYVGAPGYDTDTGFVAAFNAPFTTDIDVSDATWAYESSGADTRGERFGTAVAVGQSTNTTSASVCDLFVGAPSYDVGAATNEGRAYIFYATSGAGGLSLPTLSHSVVFTGSAGAQMGGSLNTVGDVNNDSYGDLQVGSSNTTTGIAKLYIGSAAGLVDSGWGTTSGCIYAGPFGYENNNDVYGDWINVCLSTNSYVRTHQGNTTANLPTVPAFQSIAGPANGSLFGKGMAGYKHTAVSNAVTFIAIGAPGYNTNDGAVYIRYTDKDNDGSPDHLDCNDTSNKIYPGAAETVADGVDQDCNGVDSCYTDADNDGYGTAVVLDGLTLSCATDANRAAVSTDCDDAAASVHLGATETVADGIDQDCDSVDSCYTDADDDGYGTAVVLDGTSLDCIADANRAAVSTDCSDASAARYPGAAETVADGIDQDCDSVDSCYTDADNDGYGTAVVLEGLTLNCVTDASRAAVSTDCDDAAVAIHPAAAEVAGNTVDENCNASWDCYANADGDSYRTASTVASADNDCSDAGEALSAVSSGDCDDASASVYPGATETVADGTDQDCDSVDSCYTDADNDSYGTAVVLDGVTLNCTTDDHRAPVSNDCNDADNAIHPDAIDLMGNGIDENCNLSEDCFANADADGFRASSMIPSADADCEDPGEAQPFLPDGDCDDQDANIFPGATEIPGNFVDEDCDASWDCYVNNDGDNYRLWSLIASLDADCADPGEALSTLATGDCNDNDASISPDAVETPGNTVDEDCDLSWDCYADADDDGFRTSFVVLSPDADCTDFGEALASLPDDDCHDLDDDVYPGATELIGDGVDQDCDGLELCYTDADADLFRTSALFVSLDTDCTDPGEALASLPNGDCDDDAAAVHPGATEIPGNGLDETCDGLELCFRDADSDQFRMAATTLSPALDCASPGLALEAMPEGDCDDQNPAIYPQSPEVVGDGTDQDCDGVDLCYADQDNDQYGTTEVQLGFSLSCVADPQRAAVSSDCDDQNAAIHPDALEIPGNGLDDDCDGDSGTDGDGDSGTDGDGDGVASVSDGGEDCDDNHPNIFPGAPEVANGIDDDCDGVVDEGTADADDDGDGFTESGGDCDDADAARHPGAVELDNGLDDDCDGDSDDSDVPVADSDADGDGFTPNAGDCYDADPLVYPGAPERLNGVDDNCDGQVDEGTLAFDDDADGFTELGGDCDDAQASTHPGAAEVINGVDEDCDELIDEGTAAYDDDGDGWTENQGDCDDSTAAISPHTVESVNGVDDDCDGDIDEDSLGTDDDGDGFSELGGDCNDSEAAISPNASEVLNGLDDDCDGQVDEGSTASDDDGDGFTEDEGDCNDQAGHIHPEAAELCAAAGEPAVDEDCDGEVEEDCEPLLVEPPAREECGCQTTSLPFSLLVPGLASLWIRRRRTPECLK